MLLESRRSQTVGKKAPPEKKLLPAIYSLWVKPCVEGYEGLEHQKGNTTGKIDVTCKCP